MEELLDIIKFELLGESLVEEEASKLKAYIESGLEGVDLKKIKKCNMEIVLVNYYNIELREKFWRLMDGIKKNKEVFKRILKVFLNIGNESFFKAVYGRFHSVPKVLNYLRIMEDKSDLLIWTINSCTTKERESIIFVQKMINEDKSLLLRTFLKTEDEFVKLNLAALAIKNSYELPVNPEEFIQHFENERNINNYLEYKQIILVDFLAYAACKSEEVKKILGNIINKSTSCRKLYSHLERNLGETIKMKEYDLVESFKIDKRLYILRLINLYIREEEEDILYEINEKIEKMPKLFRESLEFIDNSKKIKGNVLNNVERLMLSYLIYSKSKRIEDLDIMKKAVKSVFEKFICKSKDFKDIKEIEKEKLQLYIVEGKYKGIVDKLIGKVKGRGESYISFFDEFSFRLIYSIKETRNILYRFLELQFKLERYNIVSLIIDSVLKKESVGYDELIRELRNLGVSESSFLVAADKALNNSKFNSVDKLQKYILKLCINDERTIDALSVTVKANILEILFINDKEKYRKLLIGYLESKSKKIRSKVINLLSYYENSNL
ncbi:hypothetical protein [Clostridium felsineum]|uniref:hypothetical protein n=1 Tax=Clostridium felsineum TaxID=36839 RepID=UPI00098C84A2|nr:hypothetical protein [Clostridium felsineum]URZ01580.1 hypothetical protein CLAUR_015750 [Clostridium felsineum]